MDQDSIFIIGAGEVGRRLSGALESSGRPTKLVTRSEGWDEVLEASGHIKILAMREDDLPGALQRFPREQRSDLVLIQNGFLEAVLGDLGLVTRGLIWFTSKGDFFQVLRPSPFYGPRASELAGRLDQGGLDCEELPSREIFLQEMILKGVWNCVVGLPLGVHDAPLSEYLAHHRTEARDLCEESALAASAQYGVQVSGEEAFTCLLETTGDLGWVRGGAKALDWRNGAVAKFGRIHGVPTPVNDRLLSAVDYTPA